MIVVVIIIIRININNNSSDKSNSNSNMNNNRTWRRMYKQNIFYMFWTNKKKQRASTSIWDHSRLSRMTHRQHLNGPGSTLVSSMFCNFHHSAKLCACFNRSRANWETAWQPCKKTLIINKHVRFVSSDELGAEMLWINRVRDSRQEEPWGIPKGHIHMSFEENASQHNFEKRESGLWSRTISEYIFLMKWIYRHAVQIIRKWRPCACHSVAWAHLNTAFKSRERSKAARPYIGTDAAPMIITQGASREFDTKRNS